MAAVDPSESLKRQKSPAEEVETSGERTGVAEPECSSGKTDETKVTKTQESCDGEQRADIGSDGGCVASHSEVSVESGAGADKTTCHLAEDLTSGEKMAEAPGGDQRAFDWSETEDDDEGETKTHREENDERGMLTVLMYFMVSFSLQANLSYTSHSRCCGLKSVSPSICVYPSPETAPNRGMAGVFVKHISTTRQFKDKVQNKHIVKIHVNTVEIVKT